MLETSRRSDSDSALDSYGLMRGGTCIPGRTHVQRNHLLKAFMFASSEFLHESLPGRRPVRVLVVERDQMDRMALERLVLRQGLPYELVTAATGSDAMQRLRSGSFDVVLLDPLLGDMPGLEVMPELRGTPTVVLTTPGYEDLAISAIRGGAYDYLLKDRQGAYLNLLPYVIQNVLERRRLEADVRETQRRLSALMESLSGMAFRCTAERVLLSVSAGCLELTGYGARELADLHAPKFRDLIAPEDEAAVAAAVRRALESGQALDCTYRIVTRAGMHKWVREKSIPVRGPAGLAASGDKSVSVHHATLAVEAFEGYIEDLSPRVPAAVAASIAADK